jgi:divalent metal cation (Fe/Co/Zn/Cd) transporter
VPCFLVALQVGSLTLLGEVLRGVLLISIAIASWIMLRRIHRGQTGAYDFGMGKIEQILSLMVALLLCLSMAFLWYKALYAAPAAPHEVNTWSVAAVGLGFPPHVPFGDVARISKAVVDDIEAVLPGSRVTVTPVLPD